jgi:ERG2 and Sigma1 receptor like protein
LRLPPVGIDPSVTLFLLPKSAHCHNTAGPREYIVIFGSPTGTQGFSGRYKRVEIHKFLIADQIDSYDVESDETAPMTLCPGGPRWLLSPTPVDVLTLGSLRGIQLLP